MRVKLMLHDPNLRAVLVTVTLLTACASRTSLVPTRYVDVAEYRAAREKLIAEERALRLSAALLLTPEEEAANQRLMALKQKELERTRAHFPPAHSFLEEKTKALLASSPVLAVMRRMPKGGILHAHGSAMGDFRWLIAEATYRPDSWMYLGDGPPPRGALRIATQSPGDGWRRISELRASSPDAKAFDQDILRSITLGEEDINASDIWADFTNAFRRTSGLLADGAIAREYWRRMFASLMDENIQYLESRTTAIDQAIIDAARARDPDFDVKFIPAAGRSAPRERVAQSLNSVIALREKDPDLIKGFDLVEEEDRTNSNLFYLEELLAARREAERRSVNLPLYLHSGETSWAENENLYDAVLLGAPRIGHALALVKHPLLLQIVKQRGVAIEVCPISNQLLGYVADLRNHPAVHYINAGIPIVLSPDDPAIMQHSLSHDFYVAFMAWGLELRDLKQLAMNSLRYSAMSADEKQRALASWERRWTTFVTWLNQNEELRTKN